MLGAYALEKERRWREGEKEKRRGDGVFVNRLRCVKGKERRKKSLISSCGGIVSGGGGEEKEKKGEISRAVSSIFFLGE